jgi:hypothetical protein
MIVVLEAALVMLAAGSLVLSVIGMRRRRSEARPRGSTGPRGYAAPSSTTAHAFGARIGAGATETPPPAQPSIGPDGSVSEYRVRPGRQPAGPQWDPYAEDQSGAWKAQARRRKPRPARHAGQVSFADVEDSQIVDHYSVLGVRSNATAEEIEAAYRRYAAQVHPDRFFGDPRRRALAEEKLKQLNAIMQVLRDPARRAAYDESR